jgi:hypothetical protein
MLADAGPAGKLGSSATSGLDGTLRAFPPVLRDLGALPSVPTRHAGRAIGPPSRRFAGWPSPCIVEVRAKLLAVMVGMYEARTEAGSPLASFASARLGTGIFLSVSVRSWSLYGWKNKSRLHGM